MRLFEEYLNRHNIVVPIIHHCNSGVVLLQSTDLSIQKNRWLIITIEWFQHEVRPGWYNISISSPIHNGFLSGDLFVNTPPIQKKWDEYEDYIFELRQSLKSVVPIQGSQEITLAAWEIFACVYDGWFVKQPFEIKQSLFESLDKEKSIEHRHEHYCEVLMFLSTHYLVVARTWKYDVLAKFHNYSDWFVKLF